MSRDLPLPKDGKIPANALHVFKGELFDVYQWEQELYDGSRVTFEKLRRDDTSVVIAVTDAKKILLLEQEQPSKPPFLDFAAGRIEIGEVPSAAARRELLEETGYVAGHLELWYTDKPVSKIDWTVFVYVARGCKKIQHQQLDAGEKITVREISFDDLIDQQFLHKLHDTRLSLEILQAKLDPHKMQKLQKLFFGKG